MAERASSTRSSLISAMTLQRIASSSPGAIARTANEDEKQKGVSVLRKLWKIKKRYYMRLRELNRLWSVSLMALSSAEDWMCLLSVVNRSSSGGGGGGWDDVGLGFGAIRFPPNRPVLTPSEEWYQRLCHYNWLCSFNWGRRWVGLAARFFFVVSMLMAILSVFFSLKFF